MEQLHTGPIGRPRARHEPVADHRHPRGRQLDVRAGIEHRRDRGGRARTRLLGQHREHRSRPIPQSITHGLAHLMAQSIEGLVVIAPQVRVFRALAAQSPRHPLRDAAVHRPRPRPHALGRPDRRRPPGHKTPDQPGPPVDLSPRRTAGLDRGRGAHAGLPRRDGRQRHALRPRRSSATGPPNSATTRVGAAAGSRTSPRSSRPTTRWRSD